MRVLPAVHGAYLFVQSLFDVLLSHKGQKALYVPETGAEGGGEHTRSRVAMHPSPTYQPVCDHSDHLLVLILHAPNSTVGTLPQRNTRPTAAGYRVHAHATRGSSSASVAPTCWMAGSSMYSGSYSNRGSG